MDFFRNIDTTLLYWLNSWAGTSRFWDWTILFRAAYLWYIVLGALGLMVAIGLVKFFFRALGFAVQAALSAVVARLVIVEGIRFLYERPRPFAALEGVRKLVENTSSGSFPSGHAALAFAVATSVAYYYPKTSILFFIAALSIGLGRVAAGVHWPSDIIAGAAVGVVSAWLVRQFLRRIFPSG